MNDVTLMQVFADSVARKFSSDTLHQQNRREQKIDEIQNDVNNIKLISFSPSSSNSLSYLLPPASLPPASCLIPPAAAPRVPASGRRALMTGLPGRLPLAVLPGFPR